MNNHDFVLESAKSLLDNISSAYLADAVSSLKSAKERKRPAIAVIGLGSLKYTADVLNNLLGYGFLDADRLAYVQKPCCIGFTYDREVRYPSEDLEKLYGLLEENSDEAVSMSIKASEAALRDCDVKLLFFPQGNEAIDIKKENALFDYLLFVTNAPSALNIPERNFLSEYGENLIGKERLAFVFANSGFVSAADYELITEAAESFLEKTLGGKIPVLADDPQELRGFYERDIKPRVNQYYESTLNRISNYNVKMINETILKAKKDINTGGDEINRAVRKLEQRREMFAKKSDSLCSMLHAFIEGRVKAPLLREADDYTERLKDKALKGVQKLINAEDAELSVENYFRASWDYFLKEQMPNVRDMFEEEANYIEKQIQADIDELFWEVEDYGSGNEDSAEDFSPLKGAFLHTHLQRPGMADYAGDGKPLKISTLAIAAAVPLAIVNLPMALLAATASITMRSHEKRQEREHMSSSIKQMVYETADYYKKEIRWVIEEKFTDGTNQLCESIDDSYSRMINSAIKTLRELEDSAKKLNAKIEFINYFEAKVLPRLNM